MIPYRLTNFAKTALSIFICLLGIPLLIREWVCRNRVAILLYHDVNPEIFAKHIAYLSRHYAIISLDTLVSAIYNKDFSEIPQKSIVITIDDGHAGNVTLLPIFKQYRIYPTIYVCTQIINTHRHFWFRILERSKKERLKKLPNVERLTRLKQEVDFEPEKEYRDRQALNTDEMKEMMQDVDFQPHTQFHPILPHCTETECKQEILGSKMDLEKYLGIECLHFSYPNGDYTEREIEIVKAGGFRSARTTDLGWNGINTSPYKLQAISISDNAGLIRFRAELTTIPQRLGKWVNSLLWRITN
ncbi:MAG: polysaccharide deacetylase family protein [Candidatus Poribacteria bacterium]|nr:polysaccharide deacetylase family protein [Candidatus Poribacteria bacterium]